MRYRQRGGPDGGGLGLGGLCAGRKEDRQGNERGGQEKERGEAAEG